MKKIICMGDSITAGYPYFEEEVKWLRYVERELNVKTYEGSMSGAGFVFLSNDLNAVSIANNQNFKDYDVAILAYGINDYGKNVEIGSKDDFYQEGKDNTVYGSLNYIIKKIKDENPNIKIIFSLPIMRRTALFGENKSRIVLGDKSNYYAFGYKNLIGYTLDDYCDAIINKCKENNCLYISHKNLAFNVDTVEKLTVEGLHPNREGYVELGNEMVKLLKDLI